MVALWCDVLRGGACSPDAIDRGLIHLHNERSIFRIVFIVGVEHYEVVALVLRSKVLPEGLEGTRVCNNFIVEATIVMRANQRIGAELGDVVDLLSQIAEVIGIKRGSD